MKRKGVEKRKCSEEEEEDRCKDRREQKAAPDNPERQMIRAVVRAEVQQKHCDAADSSILRACLYVLK